MARFSDIEADAPEFAARLRAFLEARVHKTIATLRVDGSPRISGIEAFFFDGDLWFGSMPRALKARDLQRDPRFALHSGSDDPPGWSGDGKLSGRAEEVTDLQRKAAVLAAHGGGEEGQEPSPTESHVFRCDITEASTVSLNDTRTALVIEVWRPGQGVKRIERE